VGGFLNCRCKIIKKNSNMQDGIAIFSYFCKKSR